MYVLSKDKSAMARVDQLHIYKYPAAADYLWAKCCALGIGGYAIGDNSVAVGLFSTLEEAQETMTYIAERINAGYTVVELQEEK